MNYSTGFKNSVLKKVLPPENRSISEVSKEKALAEMAALLVLKKKLDNLWGDNEDD